MNSIQEPLSQPSPIVSVNFSWYWLFTVLLMQYSNVWSSFRTRASVVM